MSELEDSLSERELDVLKCVVQGASNREIALTLSISHNTVKVHLRNIFAKLGVASRTEASTVALQLGLVSIPGVTSGSPTNGATGDAADDAPPAPASEPPEPDEAPTPVAITAETPPAAPELTAPEIATTAASGRLRWGWAIGALLLTATALIVISLWSDRSAVNGAATAEIPMTAVPVTPIGESNWFNHGPQPLPRSGMASAVIGLNLYLIGGETADGQVVSAATVYQTGLRQWQTAADKPTAVADATAAVLFGELYVVGGRANDGRLTAVVEAYSPANNAWRRVAALPRPIAGGLTLSNGSFLYHFGGWDGQGYLADSYVYDPGEDSWRPLPPMTHPRAWAAGEYVVGQLYIVGGYDGRNDLTACETFDPNESLWLACPDTLQPRAGAGATSLFNRLYLIGGGLHEEVNYGELYNPVERQWSVVNVPMLMETPAWAGLSVVTVERDIFAVGGRRGDQPENNAFVYAPFPFQINIPAAPGGRD